MLKRMCKITDAETRAVHALCGDVRLWTAAKLRDAGFDLQREITYSYNSEAHMTVFTQTYVCIESAAA